MKQKYVYKTRSGWYVTPSALAYKSGVVERKYFTDYDAAVAYAKEMEIKVAEWKSTYQRIRRKKTDEVSVEDLISHYLMSTDFNGLADKTKEKYTYVFNRMKKRMMKGVPIGERALTYITPPVIAGTYEAELRDNGVYLANEYIDIFRLLFNYGIRHGFITYNPYSYVKKRSKKHRKVMWDRGDVRAFLNIAFARFRWRNIGIIFYCIYEWGQRVGDICNLKWEQVNMEERYVTIKQQKRGSIVKLPMSNGLYNIFAQQKKEFFRQQWVAPQLQRRDGKWVPYTVTLVNDYFDKIKKEAGLSSDLQLRDLRRTAITETIENGADALQVMMLSGHNSTSSLMPYFVHTLKGAQKAQEIREFPDQLIEFNPSKGRRYERLKQYESARP